MNDLISICLDFIYEFSWVFIIGFVTFILIMLISLIRLLEKANINGYKALIPIYNLYLFIKIADYPFFTVPLLLIPGINVIFFWIISVRLARYFGKGKIFKIGICLFPILFYPVLAFSKCLYKASVERSIARPLEKRQMRKQIVNENMESVPEVVKLTSVEIPIIPREIPNALGVVDKVGDDSLILDVDSDKFWQNQNINSSKKNLTNAEKKEILQMIECPVCRLKVESDIEECPKCGNQIGE